MATKDSLRLPESLNASTRPASPGEGKAERCTFAIAIRSPGCSILRATRTLRSWRLTTKLSDGAPAYQHAGAPALVCALGSAARGRALYVSRRSLQRLVRRRSVGHSRYLPLDPDG